MNMKIIDVVHKSNFKLFLLKCIAVLRPFTSLPWFWLVCSVLFVQTILLEKEHLNDLLKVALYKFTVALIQFIQSWFIFRLNILIFIKKILRTHIFINCRVITLQDAQ